MPPALQELSGYDITRSRQRLLERRAAWAHALGPSPSDHTGRRPLEGLPRPELEPDPDARRRSPLYLARQYDRVLAATPAFVDPWDPLPSAFGWQLSSLLPGVDGAWFQERLGPDGRWGARHVGVGIGMAGHWVPDLEIGLTQGWGGVRARIARSRAQHRGGAREYLEALDAMAAAAQRFVQRHAAEARARSMDGLAAQIEAVVEHPPKTFWQAVVWLALFMTLNRAYNGMNVIGRLDQMLWPFYEVDVAEGRLSEEAAVFLLQALMIHDTHFICLGGTDPQGRDASNPLSRLVLEAWRGIRGPANIGLRVHPGLPPDLLALAAEILLETGEGTPSLVNDGAVAGGLQATGMPAPAAWSYAYGGCHWWGVPGRQYGLSDGTKINLPAILLEALDLSTAGGQPGMARLWELVEEGTRHAFARAGAWYRIHLEESGRVFPELFGSLWAHGPVEQGRDVFDGALEYPYFIADVMGLANVVDALVALERVAGRQYTWSEVQAGLRANFADAGPLRVQLLEAPKFGNDDPEADAVARRVRDLCLSAARAAEPPDRSLRILTGFYSWNAHNHAGAATGATPDGRLAGTPLAHGANPAAGRARRGPTAMARSLAVIQPGTGASAPLHLELDPGLYRGPRGKELFLAFVDSYFDLGGTQLVTNFVSRATLEDAIRHPEAHRDLVIRVTGFSAYFVNLDPSLYPEILSRYEGSSTAA